jgi:fermentation-respiration switch protein FrsA (DUF1100 family)
MKSTKFAFGALGLATMGAVGGATYLFSKTIKREGAMQENAVPDQLEETWGKYKPLIQEGVDWIKSQEIEEVSVISYDGLKLQGVWLPTKNPSHKVMFVLHGYRSSGIANFAPMTRFYHELGYNVLIVDHRGHGRSEGDYVGFGVLDSKDAKEWIQFIIDKVGESAEIILHGISMGGATAVALCCENLPPQVKGIISDCAFTSPWEVFEHVLRTSYHLPSFPILNIADKLSREYAGYGFTDIDNIERVKFSKLPILFIHGAEDTFVPTNMSERMYDACTSEKELVIIPEAKHGESCLKFPKEYQQAVNKFLSKLEETTELNA